MADQMSKQKRSALMAKVRSKGNRSTEIRVESALKKARIAGWSKHPKRIPGCPDFYFSRSKLSIFVDGCFWHACPKHGRLPTTNQQYWTVKIDSNRRRDNRTRSRLRASGFHVMRIWEHDLRHGTWLRRLERMLERCRKEVPSE